MGGKVRNNNTGKKFVLLHVGFEKPTPEVMQAWGAWFESIKDHLVDMGNVGFMGGREVSKDGTKDLGWDANALTGFSVISAESLDEAESIAAGCPFISSIRVYEVRSH